MSNLTIRAPAKLNLGLEVLGVRADGYHDIATILQAVSIFDDLTLRPSTHLELTCSLSELAGPSNLALVAAQRLQRQAAVESGASIHLTKGIPAAAGLGGASSDAAATLIAARQLWRIDGVDIGALAARLGSDVPFFLTGGTALATGRGDQLGALPGPETLWFVVVSPTLDIERKTATMYTALGPDDMTGGETINRQADRLRDGATIDPTLLVNAFYRPLIAQHPALRPIARAMTGAGAPFVALSGAGPSHYTALSTADDARHLATSLALHLGDSARVFLCQPIAEPPLVVTT